MVTVNAGAAHLWLDFIYGTLMHRLGLSPPFFHGGWGGKALESMEQVTRQLIKQGLKEVADQTWPPPAIRPVWKTIFADGHFRCQEGVFVTPCDETIRDALPPESRTARVHLLTPVGVPRSELSCVLHLAGTGDHGFARRQRLSRPLLQFGIASMILESPFYGNRRPLQQPGAKLKCVSDLLLLGRATIEEARALLYWLETVGGFNRLGVCGLSMGGVHAAMVGSLHPNPIAVTPLLAPHSASVAFCEGVLRYGTAWETLMKDGTGRDKLNNESSAASAPALSQEEVLRRMREVLSLTDVTRFPIPKKPSAVIFVSATYDAYIPKHSVLELQQAWPGAEVRWVPGGHVSSFILRNDDFRRAIMDSLTRL
ncbi:hypothetical protein CBR_g25855 [Chara braunii]|uniref:AB hydrolase-1 domain-containing protein n=1 Tax=Chara braunii TaxID=69332 RepID=A0A388L6L5_CHABU|nr:hypothetical protein CBR_g25855 [Chara braunii]|eukprot:GBG77924.1 hypothetical protein CBR_g25855 [Chara braunii]